MDYSLPAQSLSVRFSSMNGEQFCIDISTTDDDIGEGTEQFELYFENLPSASALDGDPNVLCVNILDNDGELICILLTLSLSTFLTSLSILNDYRNLCTSNLCKFTKTGLLINLCTLVFKHCKVWPTIKIYAVQIYVTGA